MVGIVVGIDLGTTNSAIGILEGERVRLLPNPLGDVLTPSAVALDPQTRRLVVGRTAKDLIAASPKSGATRFKTDMGTDRKYAVGDRALSVVDLSAHVLDVLRADAERELKTIVNRCVVTVPAHFDDAQRHATRQAAEQAGFVVERIINEPTAAAIAFGMHRRNDETLFAVVDLGGGTFDVCVMELFEGILQVRGVAGESRLGGEDFTAALADHIAERAGIRVPNFGTAGWSLLYKRAELAKRALTRWPSTEVSLAGEVTGGEPRDVVVTADDADRIWQPFVDRLRAPIRAALQGAGVTREQIADVILVGGATRMPCVRRAVVELFGREPLAHGDPDLLVAHGAAIQAGMIDGNAAVQDMVVTDVASHSLGIAVSRRIGSRDIGGYFSPIIHRNTAIPTTQADSFSTVHDDQTGVDLAVYEGDGRRVEENRKIGQLAITKIPKGPAPKSFTVRFTYDVNGMLEVEAEVEETGAKASAVFKRDGGTLTEAQLEDARRRLRAVRADPMDRPRYRDLYARAKLLWRELDHRKRDILDALIAQFEGAMQGRDPSSLERAYTALLQHCETLDRGERW
ncbi:MAG: Hsp70 family protein [Myxococcota bacterium]|nr:Hsp70 family protein [Myxococcota bacterium]